MIIRFDEKITKFEVCHSTFANSASRSSLYLRILEDDVKHYLFQIYSDQRPDLLYELTLKENSEDYYRLQQKQSNIRGMPFDKFIAMTLEHLSESMKGNKDKVMKFTIPAEKNTQEICRISLSIIANQYTEIKIVDLDLLIVHGEALVKHLVGKLSQLSITCSNERQSRLKVEKEMKEIEAVKSRNMELERVIQELEEKCDQLQDDLQEYEAANNKNLNQIEILNALSERINEEKLVLNQENEELRVEIEELHDENRILKNKASETERILVEKNEILVKLQDKYDETKRHSVGVISELTKEISQIKEDLILKSKSIERLNDEKNDWTEEKKKMEEKITQLEDDNKVVRNSLSTLRSRLEAKEQAFSELCTRCTCHFSRPTTANNVAMAKSARPVHNIQTGMINLPAALPNLPYAAQHYLPNYTGFLPMVNQEHVSIADKENDGSRKPRSKSPFAINAPKHDNY